MVEVAAIVASLILACLVIFQVLLVCGMPYGRFAWGGQHTVLPLPLRLGSITSILLYFVMSGIILNQSGVLHLANTQGWPQTALLVSTIYSFFGIPLNALSRSIPERKTMTPIVATLAILFLFVKLNS